MTAVVAALVAGQPAAHACSRVLWASPDGQVFVGRTQDWTERVDSAFRVHPRGIERTGAVAENPRRWTTKYGSLVLSAYDMGTHEGVNEKGLAGHALYLAGEEVSFGARDPRRPGIGVMQWVQYYLDNFATVAEAVEARKIFALTSGSTPRSAATSRCRASEPRRTASCGRRTCSASSATSRCPSARATPRSRTSPAPFSAP